VCRSRYCAGFRGRCSIAFIGMRFHPVRGQRFLEQAAGVTVKLKNVPAELLLQPVAAVP